MLIILVVAHPRLLSAGRPFILRVSRDIGTEGIPHTRIRWPAAKRKILARRFEKILSRQLILQGR
jgi:hypothetical protein